MFVLNFYLTEFLSDFREYFDSNPLSHMSFRKWAVKVDFFIFNLF